MAQNFLLTPQRINENGSSTAFLNGKSMQRNVIEKRKNALGDIKNYAPMTPGFGCDKKSSKALNAEQLSLNLSRMTDIDFLAQLKPSDRCSSKAVDSEKVWADRFQLTDAEVNQYFSNGLYCDEYDELPPPPPSPYDVEPIPLTPPSSFGFDINVIPIPLDSDDHFANVHPDNRLGDSDNSDHHHSDDDGSFNRSIFEFSDPDLSFEDLSTNFAGRMNF